MTKAQQQLDALEEILATPISLKAKKHTPPHFESLTGKEKFLASIEYGKRIHSCRRCDAGGAWTSYGVRLRW